MSTEAQKRAQRKYSQKRMLFSATYNANEIEEGQRLKSYLELTGQSANAYLKDLIKKDLDSKCI